MLRTLIIGGGIQGTQTDIALNAMGASNVRTLDPNPEAFAVLEKQLGDSLCHLDSTPNMRSGWSAHLDPTDPEGLLKYAAEHRELLGESYIDTASPPTTAVLWGHAREACERHCVCDRRIIGRALSMEPIESGGIAVKTTVGTIETKSIVLAIGQPKPNIPGWAEQLRQKGAQQQVLHVFQPDFDWANLKKGGTTYIIGGGITAAQFALAAKSYLGGKIVLLSRRSIKDETAVPTTNWKNFKEELAKIPNFDDKYRLYLQHTDSDAIPPVFFRKLMDAIEAGEIEWRINEVNEGEIAEDGRLSLRLKDDSTKDADQVLLTTGFQRGLPGGEMVREAIANLGLETSEIFGQPVVDANYQWRSRIGVTVYVTGAMAAVVDGHRASHISGGMIAASEIANDLVRRISEEGWALADSVNTMEATP